MVDTSLMENRPTIDATGNQFDLIQFALKKKQKHFYLFVCLFVCTPLQFNKLKSSGKQM
jgi:hypothetical protein